LRFKNKIALVTGAETGIGKSVVKKLLSEGCKVIGTNFSQSHLKNNQKLEYYTIDVTQEEQWKNLKKYLEKKYKKIDILINNAGIRVSGDVEKTSLELWNHVLSTNITSIFLGCKYTLPLLKKSKIGSIVNLASITSIRGAKNMLAYATSKSAIVSFTASLALDLVKYKIRVNAVAPGAIDTQMVTSLKKEINSIAKYNIRMKEAHPIGRIGYPQEVANLVCFLASEEASFMTGSTIPVDGGRSIR
jgi:meso-butanediol dehydrogenase / (S,S)-butanediol dehydrogenase / diacetyl reductase